MYRAPRRGKQQLERNRSPGADSQAQRESTSTCGECHDKEIRSNLGSLHTTQQGYWTVLEARGAVLDDPALQEMFGNHCASCHTSCGDCRVSQPASVGGGLLNGHNFTANSPTTRTCTACHGSRIGAEYLGQHDDLRADVQFRLARMTCIDCRTGNELHGMPPGSAESLPSHRHEAGVDTPQCEARHISALEDSDSEMHRHHMDLLSCQVCHSVSYTSYDSCRVAISETSGAQYFTTKDAYFTFLIGKNSLLSDERPYRYVTVRHIPVDRDSFVFYGEFAALLADMEGYNTISLDAKNLALGEDPPPFLLDVRQPSEAEESGQIEGAVLIPLRELAQNIELLPSFETPVIAYCGSGWRATIAVTALEALGWQDVNVMKGGSYGGWASEGFPLVQNATP